MRVLSICTGMGLLDRAFMDEGYQVTAGCEVDPQKRAMYAALCGGQPIYHTLERLVDVDDGGGPDFSPDGIIGGPSCQSHSKLRAIKAPKFPDLTPLVLDLLELVPHDWFMFENVVPIDIPGAVHTRCNAMHYYQPHQSRSRWFTHSPNVKPPKPVYSGSVDDLMAYSVVAGRIYGQKRGARLQGYPAASELPFPCVQLQHGLADGCALPARRGVGSSDSRVDGSTAGNERTAPTDGRACDRSRNRIDQKGIHPMQSQPPSPKAPALLTDERIDDVVAHIIGFGALDSETVKTVRLVARAIEAEVRTLAAGEQQPVAWRVRYRSEPGMIGHYPWTYSGKKRIGVNPSLEEEPLYLKPELADAEPVFEVGHGWLKDATKYPRGTLLYAAAHPVDAASTMLPKDSTGHSVG